MATARSRFLLTTGILQRRKLRYCSTNWDTSLGGFPRTTIPGTADLPETLPRCYGIARPRFARPHTTAPGAASELQSRRSPRQGKASSARQTPQEVAVIASWALTQDRT